MGRCGVESGHATVSFIRLGMVRDEGLNTVDNASAMSRSGDRPATRLPFPVLPC